MNHNPFCITRMLSSLSIVLTLGLIWGGIGQAQTVRASLYGQVLDPGGAVIPGAVVRATHVATGTAYSFTTNEIGNYDFPQVRLGEYRLEAEAPGFNRLVLDGLRLDIDQRAKVDLTLQVGAVTEVIEVSGAAPLLETSNATTGQVITDKQVQDLPQIHRIPWFLGLISAGVNPQLGMDPGGHGFNRVNNFSVNGSRGNSNELMIDGVSNVVPEGGNSGSGMTAIVILPAIDATQEFKVLTNSYSAEYGKGGGGVVTLTIKSGTNELHGSAFEFLRNDKLDANAWFNNRSGLGKGKLIRNMWGGSIGGPFIRNRLFGFFNYQGLSQSDSGQAVRSSLPQVEFSNGDFQNLLNSQGQQITIYDPLTAGPGEPRTPFENNRIPEARIDPTARKIWSFVPTERRSAGDKFTGLGNNTYLIPRSTNDDQWDTKIDGNWNDAHRSFFRFSWYHHNRNTPPNLPGSTWDNLNVADAGGNQGPVNNYQLAMGHTWTVNPTTIVDVRAGYTRLFFAQDYHTGCQPHLCANPFDPTQAGLPQYMADYTDTSGFPYILMSNYEALGAANQQYGIPDSPSLQANITKITGRHVLKFGYDARRQHYVRGGGSNRVGQFNFDDVMTRRIHNRANVALEGNSFASFLLGTPTTGSIQRVSFSDVSSDYHAFFIQDDFKVTPRLTINMGVRWDISRPMTDAFDQMSFLNLDVTSPLNDRIDRSKVPAGMASTIVGGLEFPDKGPLSGIGNPMTIDWNNFAPRIGIAYQLTPKTVIRLGYAQLYKTQIGEAVPPPRQDFSLTNNMLTTLDGARPHNYLSDPFPGGVASGALLEPRQGADGYLTGTGLSITGITPNVASTVPYIHQWNFNIQRQLPGEMMFEIAYVGSSGKQLDRRPTNWNELHPNYTTLGNQLNQLVPNPFFGLSEVPSNSVLARPTVQLGQLLRPYPQFGTVTMWSFNGADSEYHGLQTKVEKRYSHGSTFLASYVWSKLMDNFSGIPTWLGSSPTGDRTRYDWRREWAVNEEEVPHRFVFAYTYELPFGVGQRWGNRGGVLNAILGGWQIAGIVTLSAGTPSNVTTSNQYHAFGAGEQRPNSVGRSPYLPGSPQENDLYAWDRTAFSQPTPFTIGNVGRSLPDTRTDGLQSWDLSLHKSFNLSERIKLQYRAEMFNFTNTPTFAHPTTANRNFTSRDFGLITGMHDANRARQIQMALRLTF